LASFEVAADDLDDAQLCEIVFRSCRLEDVEVDPYDEVGASLDDLVAVHTSYEEVALCSLGE
jgi:hypothetical protein